MTTREEVIKAAKECNAFFDVIAFGRNDGTLFSTIELEKFYNIAFERGRKAEREECAKACESERVEDTGNEADTAYNAAIKHCAYAIRTRSTK